jgi:hypothetical protein
MDSSIESLSMLVIANDDQNIWNQSWEMCRFRFQSQWLSTSQSTLNRLISVRRRLVLEPIVTQNTKCHLKVQLVLEFPLSLFCIVKVGFH